MKPFDIQARMRLAAVFPVMVIAVLLATLFLGARADDLGQAHSERARSVARQMATASEYGLFSANAVHLQGIAAGALRQTDVRSAVILNA